MNENINPVEVAQFENETWSRCAGGYAEGFGALVADAIDPLLRSVGISEGMRCLDIGTGPGNTARSAAEAGASVVGIDFSESMLSEARRLSPGIEFLNSTAEELPFSEEAFDAVVGNYILHHSGEPDKVLSESSRVLKPGGKAAFTVWAAPEKLEAFGLFFGAVGEHVETPELPHGPLFGISDFDTYHHLLLEAGFTDTSVEELPTAWKTPSIESYVSAFRDWANLHAFPDDLRKRIEDTTFRLAERYQSGGIYSIPNPTILLSGAKSD